jgi:hypothetical protein
VFFSLLFRLVHGIGASISAIISKIINYLFILNLQTAYSLAISFVKEEEVIKSLGTLEFGWSN